MSESDKNIGQATDAGIVPFFIAPPLARARTNIVMFERMLLTLLRDEVSRLSAVGNEGVLTLFMAHFFDPVAGEDERKAFLTHFQRTPPKVVLGYARTTADLPCYVLTLESERETDNFIGDYVGETLTNEKGEYAQYRGALWESTYALTVYANNSDACAYLYQMAKLIIFGAKEVIESAGFMNLTLSGAEVDMRAEYEPEHVYARALQISGQAVLSIPEYAPDPANFRVSVYARDVIVEGTRGGVKPEGC